MVALVSFLGGETDARGADDPARETGCTVEGTVIAENGLPVARALVRLSPGDHTAVTGANGRFSIISVPAEDYEVHVSIPDLGFEEVKRRITIPLGERESLEFVMYRRTYHIDEVVVVSGSGYERGERDFGPSSVTVIERSSFENKASTVADVISATPSANINVLGGLGDYTEVSLRGSYANQVQVYIDGMLLNEAIGGAVNLATIPLTGVERIEVWRSGAPARFGGNAVGGVVNIVTRGMRTSRKTATLSYGSFNTLTANTVMNISRGMSKFHVTLDYAASDNDFEYASDNGTIYNRDDDYTARRYNDQYRSANVLGKYSRVIGNTSLLELSEHVISNRKNLPGKDNIRYSHASLGTVKNLFQARVTSSPVFHGMLEVQPTFYHIFSHERYRDPDGTVGWGVQDNVYDTNTLHFMVPVTLRANEVFLVSLTPMIRQEAYRPEHRLQKTQVPLACDREYLSLVGDLALTVPGERLKVTANMRRDRYFSSFEGEPSPVNRTTPSSRFDYLTNTDVGVRVNVLKNVALRGSYADISRVPSLYELFGDRGTVLSNPDLRPERVFKRDAGLRLSFLGRRLPVSFTLEYVYFENTYRDLIQWYTTDAGFVHPENVAGALVTGQEIVWNTRLADRLVCSGNWTFQESRVTREKRKYYRDKELPNRPSNYGTLRIEYPIKTLVPFWHINHKSVYFLDRANQEHKQYPGRTLHDIGITVSFMAGKTVGTLLVRNVGDERTFDIQGLPKPGRSFQVTVTYAIE